jgi:hypothetical protein
LQALRALFDAAHAAQFDLFIVSMGVTSAFRRHLEVVSLLRPWFDDDDPDHNMYGRDSPDMRQSGYSKGVLIGALIQRHGYRDGSCFFFDDCLAHVEDVRDATHDGCQAFQVQSCWRGLQTHELHEIDHIIRTTTTRLQTQHQHQQQQPHSHPHPHQHQHQHQNQHQQKQQQHPLVCGAEQDTPPDGDPRDMFRKEGYCLFRKVVDEDTLALLRREVESALAPLPPLLPSSAAVAAQHQHPHQHLHLHPHPHPHGSDTEEHDVLVAEDVGGGGGALYRHEDYLPAIPVASSLRVVGSAARHNAHAYLSARVHHGSRGSVLSTADDGSIVLSTADDARLLRKLLFEQLPACVAEATAWSLSTTAEVSVPSTLNSAPSPPPLTPPPPPPPPPPPRCYLFNEHFVCKPAQGGATFGWHRDYDRHLAHAQPPLPPPLHVY